MPELRHSVQYRQIRIPEPEAEKRTTGVISCSQVHGRIPAQPQNCQRDERTDPGSQPAGKTIRGIIGEKIQEKKRDHPGFKRTWYALTARLCSSLCSNLGAPGDSRIVSTPIIEGMNHVSSGTFYGIEPPVSPGYHSYGW